MVEDLSKFAEKPEDEESLKISADTYWLLQTVGEIASSVAGADFMLQITPMEDDNGVTLVMASKVCPGVVLGARIPKDPDVQIRRVCTVLAARLYDKEDEAENPEPSGLIVPKKEIILP